MESSNIPWLMLPYVDFSSPELFKFRQFFGPDREEIGLLLPELAGKVCLGSNHPDFLLVVGSGCKTSPYIINLVTKSRISLPPLPLPTFWNQCSHADRHVDFDLYPPNTYDSDNNRFLGPDMYTPFVFLAVFSLHPNFEVMVIHGRDMRLAFCQPQSQGLDPTCWTPVLNTTSRKPLLKITALACCNGRFYAIQERNTVVVCDTSVSPPTAIVVSRLPIQRNWYCRRFLVASNQDLLLVERYFSSQKNSEEYQVFKLVEKEGRQQKEAEWMEMTSIGERAIFICRENCFAISTTGFADIISPSCIYYADVCVEKGHLSETSMKLIEFSIPDKTQKRTMDTYPTHLPIVRRFMWLLHLPK